MERNGLLTPLPRSSAGIKFVFFLLEYLMYQATGFESSQNHEYRIFPPGFSRISHGISSLSL
jgi:hypothetical protein